MPVENENVDINVVFENLLTVEEKAEESGFDEGYNVVLNRKLEGYHLGYHRASILAAQLGYYTGVIIHCLNEDIYPRKVVILAEKLLEEIVKFPKINEEIDMSQSIENVRLKFAKLCSLAKIDSSSTKGKELDF